MKIHKIFTMTVLLLSLFISGANAQTKRKKITRKPNTRVSKPVVKPAPKPMPEKSPADYKILLEGSQSKVETPFIFIARDAETYALIRSMVEGLLASSTVDFSKNAVVVAFAGQRSTGGWSVAIRNVLNKTVIDIKEPPKRGMVTQAITYPFQIAMIPIEENQALNIEAAATWTNNMKNYRVTKGEFEYSGGFAFRKKKFEVHGTIGVLTFGDHRTYLFNLSGKGQESGRRLSEMASGVLKEGGVEIARVDAGTFSDSPRPPLKVMGTATGNKLLLKFDPLPTQVADGFTAQGKIEAVKK